MATESDAVVVHTSEVEQDFLLFASDLEIETDGSFQIDVIALDVELSRELDLSLTSAATRTLTKWLRDDEPHIQYLLDLGAVSEGDDGLLDKHPLAIPSLRERAELNGFVSGVNERRQSLYSYLVSSNLEAELPALEAEVGSLCGKLWEALRSDVHALR
jgi:hypothetical protein